MKNVTFFTGLARLSIICLLWVATSVRAQIDSSTNDCAQARDPVRCLARADAIAACADLRGTSKRDCLLTRLPPPDCKAAPNPTRCDIEQAAKESCKAKSGKALSDCLRENGVEAPKKPKNKKKPKSPSKTKASTTPQAKP